MMKARNCWILGSIFLAGCVSTNTQTRTPAGTPAEVKIPTRDEVMGPNRARLSVKPKANKDYIFRNVASAFPDTGKNMLLKDRAVPKSSVSGALDHSPWHLRIYNNPDHIAVNQARFSNGNKSQFANSTPLSQAEAVSLARTPKVVAAEPFYQSENFGQDDSFEPNNTIQQAFDLTTSEDRWLGLLGPKGTMTEGVQSDDDWYKISVSPQYRRLILDLRFQHYLGDIDMQLYDAKGNLIATSQGNSEDEFIHLILDRGGIYFVKIYGSNRGNRYDFKYSTFFTGGSDDEYEENDTLKTAYDLRPYEGRWLSEVHGEGVAADDDFYLIRAPAGRTRLQVDFRCDVDRGDVDIRLLNAEGKIIASSANIGDDDFIDFTVPAPGNYYLKVYTFAPQSSFNLYDFKWTAEKPSQSKPSKSSAKGTKALSETSR